MARRPARTAKSRRGTAAPTPAPRRATRGTPAPFITESAAAAYAHFRDVALAAAADAPGTYNADLAIVPHNVDVALTAIAEHLGRPDLAPDALRRIRELPALVLALVHADSRVVDAASPQAIADAQSVLRPLRQDTLSYLEAVSGASCPIVPAERVLKIRQNKGPIDEARDAIAIVGVFTDFATQLQNKHPFTPAQLATLQARGTYLLRALASADAAAPLAVEPPTDEVLVRNGLWALAQHAFDDLLLVAAKVWGVRAVYDHVPALLSRARPARATDAAPSATSTDPAKPS